MDKRQSPQWKMSGIIEAPIEKVWESLLEANGLTQTVREAKGNLIVTEHPYEGRTEIDLQKHTISRQGHWWYRGIHRVEPHPRGSLIRYEVYNIAPGIGWWAAQLVQGPQHAREMKHNFETMLQNLGQCLECPTAIVQD